MSARSAAAWRAGATDAGAYAARVIALNLRMLSAASRSLQSEYVYLYLSIYIYNRKDIIDR